MMPPWIRPARLRRMLPVYISSRTRTLLWKRRDQEDNWAQLEQLLREYQDELTEDEPGDGFPVDQAPRMTPPRPSLQDDWTCASMTMRLQTEVTEPLLSVAFTDWLTGLSTPSEDGCTRIVAQMTRE